MINFKNLRWKNFLSTGNAWTEIDFERSPSTLIIGENGSGKSTLLDALTYALFNNCLLYTSPSPRDLSTSRMPSSA